MMHPLVPVPVPVPVNLPIPDSGMDNRLLGNAAEKTILSPRRWLTKRRAKLAPDVLFRIVVPSRQIGKEGFRIQKICEDTKATIKIADAIARHEERVIIISSKDSDGTASDAENALQQIASLILQISGDGPAVLKALEEIGSQLRENPPREVISISPSYNYTSIRPPQQYLDPTSADYVTFEMIISETLVGGLISRCGSNISRIRIESGAMIKVYGGKGEQKHRQIQFGGSTQQVALAKQRVDEYTYSQLIQQASAQQQV